MKEKDLKAEFREILDNANEEANGFEDLEHGSEEHHKAYDAYVEALYVQFKDLFKNEITD